MTTTASIRNGRQGELSGHLHYTTALGAQYSGDSRHLLGELDPESVDLFVTSPPFPLLRPKEYGNADQEAYVGWLLPFAEAAHRALKASGSLVLDLGGAYQRGRPVRSLHQFRVLLALTDRLGFHLAQDLYWHNPSRLPSPAEWVTKRKIRAKDTVNTLWWLSRTPFPKADTTAVKTPYSASMRRLLADPRRHFTPAQRPSGHHVGDTFDADPGDLVVDFFSGSNAAARLPKPSASAGWPSTSTPATPPPPPPASPTPAPPPPSKEILLTDPSKPDRGTHIVWDWNGTLKDDLTEMVLATNVTLAALGGPPIDRATYQELHRMPIRDFYARVLERPLSESEWALAEETYLQHIRSRPVELRAGAAALLATLHAQGYRQSLLSLSRHDVLTAEASAAGVSRFFERIDGRRGTNAGKTGPMADHLASLPHPVPPRRVIIIGDTLDDGDAAHAAGAHAVLFTGGLQLPDLLIGSRFPVADTLPAAVRTGLGLVTPSGTNPPPPYLPPRNSRGKTYCR